MRNLSKSLLAVTLTLSSVNVMADASGLDAIRDNLKDMYNDLSTGAWTGSTYTDARSAIESLAQHTDELSRTQVSFDFINGISVSYEVAYNQTEFDKKVDAISDGVLTDLFGTSDQDAISDRLITTDANGRLSTDLVSGSDLLYNLVDTEFDELNTAMDSGDIDTIDTAITDFGTAFTSFNSDFTEFWGTDKGLLEGITDRDGALDYGIYYSAAEAAYVSGDDCYDSYSDYAKGITGTCASDD